MKTLKKNEPNYTPKTWSKVAKCTGRGPIVTKEPCGSILEVEESDIVYAMAHGAYMTDDKIYGFRCKECGCFTKIHAINIPKRIREQAKRLNRG